MFSPYAPRIGEEDAIEQNHQSSMNNAMAQKQDSSIGHPRSMAGKMTISSQPVDNPTGGTVKKLGG